jgi:hypothetical protein
MSHSATIVLLAKELSEAWTLNLSNAGNFDQAEARRLTALAKAEELGIRSDVYTLANKMMNGEA